ncbi:MAG: aminotransferase class V-fold PLP-dependent enzyme, partial [Candidatus Poribacteria bacterium]|nr:aminotransferase class V-fold PLP-dependent enzyme [Candidatus Poribacteria bacterium]
MTLAFDVESIRRDFPALHQEIDGKPLVYLDNGATAQKPQSVIDAVRHYYERDNANVHRGVHRLSQRATEAYENTRVVVQRHLNAAESHEIIFTKGTTDAINLVAHSFGRDRLKAGDEVLISTMEHHSNIVPWQMLCEEKGAKLRVVPMNQKGELLLDEYERMLSERTKIVALNHVSNALGTINPVREMIAQAHAVGAVALLDGAQAAPHMRVDVRDLDADFYALSGHKLFGPNGIGVLYGKRELLEQMPPYQGGGDMIAYVT